MFLVHLFSKRLWYWNTLENYSLHISYKICYKKSTKGHFYLADVAKMNHVRGSGGGAQIRASHSQSDPVSLGKVCVLEKATKFDKISISFLTNKFLFFVYRYSFEHQSGSHSWNFIPWDQPKSSKFAGLKIKRVLK